MRYVETTIKVPLADNETAEDGDTIQSLLESGAGVLLTSLGRDGAYWSIRTEDPGSDPNPNQNIHDHRSIVKAAGGRHDHEAPSWGANHRHIDSINAPAVPPIVVGCLGVTHSYIDCFAAGVPGKDLCRVCQSALGRPL